MNIKEGIKTTEFWGKTIIQVIALVAYVKKNISPEEFGAIVAGLEAIYTIARALIKKNAESK